MMKSSLPVLFSKLVNHLVLQTKSENYSFSENNVNYIFKVLSVKEIFGGRVEWDKIKMFSGASPEHVAKMCDAFFVVHHKHTDFICLVETKLHRKKDYRKQLDNGKRWCEWLLTLLKDHGHYHNQPKFVGLLIMNANPSQPLKPTTSRNHENIKREPSGQGYDIYRTLVHSKQPTIYLQDYLQTR